METHYNILRQLYDYQFPLACTPVEFEQCHRTFIQTHNTTAHERLLKDRRLPPTPVEVLGTAKGRPYAPEAPARHFAQAVFPRTTNRYGCVTVHSYHVYVAVGLPHTQVLPWVAGTQSSGAARQEAPAQALPLDDQSSARPASAVAPANAQRRTSCHSAKSPISSAKFAFLPRPMGRRML